MGRAPKHCGIDGCKVVVSNGRRCPDHAHGWKASPRTASSARTNTTVWKSNRLIALERDNYTCQTRGPRCTIKATEVDHIIPVTNGGTDDLYNLASTCHLCHNDKTQLEARQART